MVLDLREGGPSAFALGPPSCLVYLWRPGTRLVTHTSYIGEFEMPYPFHEHGRLIE